MALIGENEDEEALREEAHTQLEDPGVERGVEGLVQAVDSETEEH